MGTRNGTAPQVSADEFKAAFRVDDAALEAAEAARLTSRIHDILDRLEMRTTSLAAKVQKGLVPMAETKVKENIWRTILIAVGLGFFVGLLLRFRSKRGP